MGSDVVSRQLKHEFVGQRGEITLWQAVALLTSFLAASAALATVLGLVLFAVAWSQERLTMTPLSVAAGAALCAHFLLRWSSLAQTKLAELGPERRNPSGGSFASGLPSALVVALLMALRGFFIIQEHGSRQGGVFIYMENARWAGGAWILGGVVVLAETYFTWHRSRSASKPT